MLCARFAFVLCVSCGGAIATEDATDASAPIPKDAGMYFDAGGVSFVDAMLPPALMDVPIDVGQWRDAGLNDSCGFEVSGAAQASVNGDKVVAFRSGGEIPVVVFGCSGPVLGKRYSILASDVPDTTGGQWALLDLGEATYFVNGSHITSCAMSVTAPSLNVGSAVSGSFSCDAMRGTIGATATVSTGQFATSLVTAVPFKLPN